MLPTVLPRTPKARTRVRVHDVPARVLPVLDAAAALAALPPPDDWPAWRRPGDSVLAWSMAAKLALELVAAGKVVPLVRAAGSGRLVASWRAVAADPRVADLAARFPPAAHALRRDGDAATVWSAADSLDAFCDAVADASARAAASRLTGTGTRDDRSLARRWTDALTTADPELTVEGTGASAEQLVEQVSSWIAPVAGSDGHASARLCLQLRTPPDDDDAGDWSLDYLLQAADDPSLLVPAEQVWSQAGPTLRLLGRRLGDPQETLVRGLAAAARLFPPVAASLSEPRPTALALKPAQAAELLGGAASELAAAGLGVRLPAELTAAGSRRLRARLRVGATPDPGAGLSAGGLDASTLGAFSWEIALGDDTLTDDEFDQIVALKQPLVRWRGQWVQVDPGEALALADLAGATGELSAAEALAAGLTGAWDADDAGEVEVTAAGMLADVLARLRDDAGPGNAVVTGVAATLRDYQQRGVAWLQAMAQLGLGTVLADDMGLGKTLQTIALLVGRAGDRPHLVVCPTSVVGNWERELARFAPQIEVVRHHGAGRASGVDDFPPGAVVITSYGLVRRDVDLLAAVDWDVVVLDEVQQVKNPAAKAARAVRRLPARQRVALTGTPVENRLSELWAIMDFCNPGLLGRFPRFKERYAVPVERWGDTEAAARLRTLVAPFLLRRTKSDPAVAADLPRKQEVTVGCRLSREQATLYQAAVHAAFEEDQGERQRAGGRGSLGEGIDRRGRILALLTGLKQICNHPAQYLGEHGPLAGRSGKLDRVVELLAEVVAAGDRALVFTQYRSMGNLLARHVAAELDLADVPFLHGGVSAKGRDAMVSAFQQHDDASPVLLISLKAGGTGLNLTRASHVIHFDRWWNPAVEDQATDRAYRIGQTRMVTAHKLVTAGTVEERIADMLASKRALADAVVGAGEAWITELDDDALRDLVALSTDDVADAQAQEAPA
jgi:superfamily II DNA or RNA helicase